MHTHRRDDVQQLFVLLSREAKSHPNKLESEGNKVFLKALQQSKNAGRQPKAGETQIQTACTIGENASKSGSAAATATNEGARGQNGPAEEVRGCLSRRAMVVVTVNCVQSVYANAVYDCGVEGSLQQLDTYVSLGRALDEEAYLLANSTSVHVPHVHLKPSPAANVALMPVKTARVSVVLPVHNAEKFLSNALDSVVHQTLTDWECICVDDASTDSSPRLLASMAARDARFRICTCET